MSRNNERKLVFLKFCDALAEIYEQEKADHEQMGIEELAEYHEHYGPEDAYYENTGRQTISTGPAIMSPYGLIPLHEGNIPSKLFNFWVGHTNFDLGENEGEPVAIIQNIPGVESLDVYTRYRFRVAIGKMFDQNKVKAAIVDAVCRTTSPANKPVGGLKSQLESRYPFWAIYTMPSGQQEIVTGYTQEEVAEKGKRFVNAKVETSWQSK